MSFPFYDEDFTFTQPDGTQFRVRGWGDQHHAVFETLDGFTVVEDPSNAIGWSSGCESSTKKTAEITARYHVIA